MTQEQIVRWHGSLRHLLAENQFWGLGCGLIVTPPDDPAQPFNLKVHGHLFRAAFNPQVNPANDPTYHGPGSTPPARTSAVLALFR